MQNVAVENLSLDSSRVYEWRLIQPTGTPPKKRYYHTACFHRDRNVMYIFGGDHPGYKNDLFGKLGDVLL